MQYLKKFSFTTSALVLMPSMAYAKDITDLKGLIAYIMEILNSLVPLFFAMAFLAFIWGIIKYLYAGGPKELGEARNYIIFGIIAMTVMLSVLGIANLIKNSFFKSTPTPVEGLYTTTNTSGNLDTTSGTTKSKSTKPIFGKPSTTGTQPSQPSNLQNLVQ